MQLSYKIIITLCLILLSSYTAAQDSKPAASLKFDTGFVYFLKNDNLWVLDLTNAQQRQITQDKKITTYRVSHSGNQVAYVIDDKQLYLLDLLTNKEIFLIEKNVLADPCFSPKDDQLIFTASSATRMEKKIHFLSNTYGAFVYHIWLLDIQTKKATDLTPESPYHHTDADWSPDGKWIAYSAMVDPWWTMFKSIPWEIYLMNMSDKKDLASKIGKGSTPKWLDSNRMAIFENSELVIYDVQAKHTVNGISLTKPCGPYFSFGPSLDIIFYIGYCGHEGRTGLVILDQKLQKENMVVFDAKDPIYVKK